MKEVTMKIEHTGHLAFSDAAWDKIWNARVLEMKPKNHNEAAGGYYLDFEALYPGVHFFHLEGSPSKHAMGPVESLEKLKADVEKVQL